MGRLTKSRLPSRPLNGVSASMPPHDHPAFLTGHTIYGPTTVRTPDRSASGLWALKTGANSRKIGGEILKGRWKGFPIFTLTLEERRTCPTSCRHWRSCYGNRMPWVHRWEAGAALEWRLPREIGLLSIDHPRGFAVRLHNLGDFYSVAYVELWARLRSFEATGIGARSGSPMRHLMMRHRPSVSRRLSRSLPTRSCAQSKTGGRKTGSRAGCAGGGGQKIRLCPN
jgi:hypothetical protein